METFQTALKLFDARWSKGPFMIAPGPGRAFWFGFGMSQHVEVHTVMALRGGPAVRWSFRAGGRVLARLWEAALRAGVNLKSSLRCSQNRRTALLRRFLISLRKGPRALLPTF